MKEKRVFCDNIENEEKFPKTKERKGRKEVSLLMSLSTYASLFADGRENGVQEG